MKRKLLLLPLAGLFLLLTSATYIRHSEAAVPALQNTSVNTMFKAGPSNMHRLGFFQRLAVKFLLKKQRLMAGLRADKLAHTSLTLGIVAMATLLIGLFVPYIILLCIPAGIAAMITGGAALRQGTSLVGRARTGKGLGLGSLIALGVLLIIAAIIIAFVAGTIY